MFKTKIDKYLRRGVLHIDEKWLDSQYVNGFLVCLLSGSLALDGNLVQSCSILCRLFNRSGWVAVESSGVKDPCPRQ